MGKDGKTPLHEMGESLPDFGDMPKTISHAEEPKWERLLAVTAAALECDGIFNPTYYWQNKSVRRGGSKSTLTPTKWSHTTIRKILGLQAYCGDVINFKTYDCFSIPSGAIRGRRSLPAVLNVKNIGLNQWCLHLGCRRKGKFC